MEALWLILLLSISQSFFQCSSIEIVVDCDKIKDVVSSQFLSMTIDPMTLASTAPFTSQTMEMAKSLSPSYVRICGQGTNFLHFGNQLFKENTTVTEKEIDSIAKFVKEANLDLIIGLNAMERENGQWRYENSHKLISYMARKGYDASWQLGYDTNSIKMEELTQDLRRLKKILSMYPIYENSLILGPDFDDNEVQNVQNFIKKSGSTVSSIVMSFGKENEKSLEKSSNDFKKTISNTNTDRIKSVVLALKDESDGSFEEAMTLAKTLGSAANLGYSMVFRKPGNVALTSPTSEFWFSYLYKMLVGNEVFETKLPLDSNVKVYSHNTPTEAQDTLFLDKGKNYQIGALTMFGVNESPDKIELNVQSGENEDVHLYVLTFDSDDKMTYLNGKKLMMQHGYLPVIAPEVVSSPKFEMPPNSIFFIVRPNAKAKSSQIDFSIPMERLITRIMTRTIKPLNLTEMLESYKKLIQSKIIPDENKDISISYIAYTDNGWSSQDIKKLGERKKRSLEEKEKEDKDDELVGAFFGENEDQSEIDKTLLGIEKEGQTNSTISSEEETPDLNEPSKPYSGVEPPAPEESQIIENQKTSAEPLPVILPSPEPSVDQVPNPGSPMLPLAGPSFIPIALPVIPMDPRSVEEEAEKEFEALKTENDKEIADSTHIQKISSQPFINERKESMINSILAKIVTTEDAKYANKPVDLTQLEYEDNTAPYVEVMDPLTKEQVFMPMEKLDSGDSISLPDYGPTTTKVQRQINTELLKEKILETRKKFGTLGKSKAIIPPPVQESELRRANENLKNFLEQRRFDFENVRSKLTEARHKLFDIEEFAPLKNPDLKSVFRSLEDSLDKIKAKLPLYEPKIRLRRSAEAKTSFVEDLAEDFAEEVDKLKDKFSSFMDSVFGKIKSITKRSTDSSPKEEELEILKTSLAFSSMLKNLLEELYHLNYFLEKLNSMDEETQQIPEIGKCKESKALEDPRKLEDKKFHRIPLPQDPRDQHLRQTLSSFAHLFSSLGKDKNKEK